MEETTNSVPVGTCARHGRFWAVTDAAGQLVCVAVYKKGAQEVLRRLGLATGTAMATDPPDTSDATKNLGTTQKGRQRGEH